MSQNLMTADTFDVAAKTLFARDLMVGHTGRWSKRVYVEHLRVWNGLRENEKCTADHFVGVFESILRDMSAGNFDWNRSPILLDNGKFANGRHRLAGALVTGSPAVAVEGDEEACSCTWPYLRARGLSPYFGDAMAIEYCRLKPNTRLAFVFGEGRQAHTERTLMSCGDIVYHKKFEVSQHGPLNLIRELYHGEPWLEGNGQWKADRCFPIGSDVVTAYVLDVDHPELVVPAKSIARNFLGRGQHSMHINDTHEETMRIARAVFNSNGLHYLNRAQPALDYVPPPQRGPIPIDSGGVLEAYGLRKASDIDFVGEPQHIEYHGLPIEDLIDDPNNYFFTRGVKFASLYQVMQMKKNRNEDKDRRDVALICTKI